MSSLFPTATELDTILVGPDSVSWRITSDLRLDIAILYPLLLQVAHPTVSAGVADFSDFARKPWERLLRTIDYACLLVYGGADAVAAGRRLRALHGRFRGVREDGVPYSALEPEAYAWVHATLIEAYVAGQARFGTPLRDGDTERFYREYRGLGRLIGVREHDLPRDWRGFRSYVEQMETTTLVRTRSVDQVLSAVRNIGPPPIGLPGLVWRAARIPAQRALWLGSVGLMSPALRRRLQLGWSRLDEAQFQTLGIISRSLTPLLPESFKVTGPTQLRYRRAAIERGPLGHPPLRSDQAESARSRSRAPRPNQGLA